MIALYYKLEKFWFNFPQKLRFLLVGGFNTVFAYFLFVGLSLFLPYIYSLMITYFIGINVSVFTMRYYVFQAKEDLKQQYIKAVTTYLILLLANAAVLYLLIDIAKIQPFMAQAYFTIFSTVLLYQIHQKVNFRA